MTARAGVELKVGLFVLIGIIVLSVIVFSIGEFGFIKRGYRILVRFGVVTGVEVGAPVRLSGVEVGQIESIRLLDQPQGGRYRVELVGWVQNGVLVPEDSSGFINTLGLLGEKYLEVSPGTSRRGLPDGGMLYGSDPIPIDRVAEQGYNALGDFQTLVNSVNDVVGDPVFRSSMKHTVARSEELVSSLHASSESLRAILEQIRSGQGTLGRLLMDETLYQELIAFVQDLKAHPWKLLRRDTSSKPDKSEPRLDSKPAAPASGNRGFFFGPR
jgi:phospholipid/cholesterol/gamma-HCH transport system substrate-binding protein